MSSNEENGEIHNTPTETNTSAVLETGTMVNFDFFATFSLQGICIAI